MRVYVECGIAVSCRRSEWTTSNRASKKPSRAGSFDADDISDRANPRPKYDVEGFKNRKTNFYNSKRFLPGFPGGVVALVRCKRRA
jgi:hypothetical protein